MTDTTDAQPRRNFLGIPIAGHITEGSSRAPQRPLAELEPLLRAVLDDPTIHAFGWAQYTPYFNDGDPCEFSVSTPWFLTVDQVEAKTSAGRHRAADYDDDDESYSGYPDGYEEQGVQYGEHPTLGKMSFHYEGDYPDRVRVEGGYIGPDEARWRRCYALSSAIESGAFENELLMAFGDHAQVQLTASGITVDFCEHH